MRPAERENRPEPPSWFEPRWRIPAARHPQPSVRRSGAAVRRAELAARWAARPPIPAAPPTPADAGNRTDAEAKDRTSAEARDRTSAVAKNRTSAETNNRTSADAESRTGDDARNRASADANDRTSGDVKGSSNLESKSDEGAGNETRGAAQTEAHETARSAKGSTKGRELSDRPQHRRVAEWTAARCDEIAGDVARGGLWRFAEVVADVLHPGVGAAVAAAQRTTKWGPQLIGLNDDRGADVKVGLVGSENLGLWVLFRTRLGQSDPGPRPDWCTDLPVGPLGREGVRREATVLSGVEDVKPADVAGLLLVPPAAGADTRVLARVDVRRRAGVLAVDPGDGAWQRRLFFTVVHPPGRGWHHERYRVVCPVCARRRLAQFRGFDVCSDCGWLNPEAMAK